MGGDGQVPVLRGGRVVLRAFAQADLGPRYIGWLNDPQVVRFSNQRFRRHDRASCQAYLGSFAGTDNLFLGVHALEDDTLIGTLTAYRSRVHGTADVGIMMGETARWGQGLGQDAWDTLTRWLLQDAGVRKLTAGTLACNLGMVRLMERSGMSLEATRRAQEIVDGRPEDILLYARFQGA
jgi:ribosomal-protein-alanine N-acetyltransferase